MVSVIFLLQLYGLMLLVEELFHGIVVDVDMTDGLRIKYGGVALFCQFVAKICDMSSYGNHKEREFGTV